MFSERKIYAFLTLIISLRLGFSLLLLLNPGLLREIYRRTGYFEEKFYIISGLKPSIYTEATEFNFGMVEPGDIVRHAFLLKNSGRAPLIIMGIYPGCDCTDVKVSRRVIRHGESSALSFAVDTTGKSGPFNTQIILQTNQMDKLFVPFNIKGWIGRGAMLEISKVDIGEIESGAKIEGKLKVFHWGMDNFRVLDVRSEKGLIKIKGFSPVDENTIEISGYLVAERTTEKLTREDTLIVYTNQKDAPELAGTIFWRVVPRDRLPADVSR